MTHMHLVFVLLISTCSSSQTKNNNAGMDSVLKERDGVFFVIKDEKATEAETKVKEWLHKIKLIKGAS
jgi:hypothetical protein